jgi:hypothetical protein
MSDSPATTSEARRSAHSARTADACRSLAGRIEALGRPNVSRETTARRQAPGPRLLIRAEVMDLVAEIHSFVEDTAPLAREYFPARPVLVPLRDRLRLIASVLPSLARMDPDAYAAVSRRVWDLGQRVSDAVGEFDAPDQLDEPCPRCGLPSLWISPVRNVVACIMPNCLCAVWPTDTPISDEVDE